MFAIAVPSDHRIQLMCSNVTLSSPDNYLQVILCLHKQNHFPFTDEIYINFNLKVPNGFRNCDSRSTCNESGLHFDQRNHLPVFSIQQSGLVQMPMDDGYDPTTDN
jgi:hypothetical protein